MDRIYALTTVLSLNYDARSRLMLATTPTSTSMHLIPVEYLVSPAGTVVFTTSKKDMKQV
jgi:hypothetical protein